MANSFQKVSNLDFLTSKVAEIKKVIADTKQFRHTNVAEIRRRTGVNGELINQFIDNDPYNYKITDYQNTTLAAFLQSRNYQQHVPTTTRLQFSGAIVSNNNLNGIQSNNSPCSTSTPTDKTTGKSPTCKRRRSKSIDEKNVETTTKSKIVITKSGKENEPSKTPLKAQNSANMPMRSKSSFELNTQQLTLDEASKVIQLSDDSNNSLADDCILSNEDFNKLSQVRGFSANESSNPTPSERIEIGTEQDSNVDSLTPVT